MTAWDAIGFDGPGFVRVVGGRALYENVDYDDSRGGRRVRLGRVDQVREGGRWRLNPVVRYVDPDTVLETVGA